MGLQYIAAHTLDHADLQLDIISLMEIVNLKADDYAFLRWVNINTKVLPADLRMLDGHHGPVGDVPVVRTHKAAGLSILLHLINLDSQSTTQSTRHHHQLNQPEH